MGRMKELAEEYAEWLSEKLNLVVPEDHAGYSIDDCFELITGSYRYLTPDLATYLWKVAQLSPEDGNKLMDISENLYVMAMEGHQEENKHSCCYWDNKTKSCCWANDGGCPDNDTCKYFD